jgi:hypothetical protein
MNMKLYSPRNVSGGTIDGAVIGGTTPAAGTFTNVEATTYGSDGSVTDAELLYINTLSSNAQTQLNAKLGNLVEDTTPQLGGDLDGQGKLRSRPPELPRYAQWRAGVLV